MIDIQYIFLSIFIQIEEKPFNNELLKKCNYVLNFKIILDISIYQISIKIYMMCKMLKYKFDMT